MGCGILQQLLKRYSSWFLDISNVLWQAKWIWCFSTRGQKGHHYPVCTTCVFGSVGEIFFFVMQNMCHCLNKVGNNGLEYVGGIFHGVRLNEEKKTREKHEATHHTSPDHLTRDLKADPQWKPSVNSPQFRSTLLGVSIGSFVVQSGFASTWREQQQREVRVPSFVAQTILHCITLMSFPPVDTRQLSLYRKVTLVTWLLWPP